MIVVADTSPVCYLILIRRVELRFQWFGSVAIPDEVRRELLRDPLHEAVREWAFAPPAWVTLHTIEAPNDLDLDRGETEAVYLAKRLGALLIVDDGKARAVAAAQGLAIIGLIGLLARGAEQGLTDFAQAVADLEQTTFRIHPSIVAPLLQRFGGES